MSIINLAAFLALSLVVLPVVANTSLSEIVADHIQRSRDSATVFDLPKGGWPFDFPADHAPHPQQPAELWLISLTMLTDDAKLMGFDSRILRLSTETPGQDTAPNNWSYTSVLGSLQTLSDGTENRGWQSASLARNALGLADATAEPLSLWINTQQWQLERRTGCALDLALRTELDGQVVEFDLSAADCDTMIQQSGPAFAGFMQPLKLNAGRIGQLTVASGYGWYQRLWGDLPLGPAPVVLDRYSLALPEGGVLALVQRRRADGSGSVQLTASWMDSGRAVELLPQTVTLEVVEDQQSQNTGRWYPTKWRLTLNSGTPSRLTDTLPSEMLLQRVPGNDPELAFFGTQRATGHFRISDQYGAPLDLLGSYDLAPFASSCCR